PAMTHARAFAFRRCMLALLAVLVGASCSDTNSPDVPLGSSANSLPDTLAAADTLTADSLGLADSTAVDSMVPVVENVSYSGMAYGAFGLWASATSFEWGPAPFTMSHDNTYANTIVARINSARQRRQRLVLAMTGGNSSSFKTNGKFDLSKWKRRMDT